MQKPTRLLFKTFQYVMVVLSLSFLCGCGGKEPDVPVVIPEQQILSDSYEANEDITKYMTYAMDYITTPNSSFFSSSMDVVPLFDHVHIQVDSWESVIVGKTSMGDLVKVIELENEKYIAENTNAIIAERQAVIDREYEEAKAKAEARGKVYDKEKKQVRTDDILFNNPYTYTVTLGTNSKAVPEEYQPRLLVDPSTYKVIYFDVAKYGIPYVRFAFQSVNNLYNTRITQESDWILNGVSAANVSGYTVNSEGDPLETYPDFVDVDGLNKAAKQNIRMSGDIAFGGEGFTWDSLMLLCNALELVENQSVHGYKQDSDSNFTYYYINLYANPFEDSQTIQNQESWGEENKVEEELDAQTIEQVYIPHTRLVATFDPATQICINWTVDTYSGSTSFRDKIHNLSFPTSVNVHEYQVDTNDYAGMRDAINTWIKNNSPDTETVYYAFNEKDKQQGIIETGVNNLNLEAVMDGITYTCLEFFDNGDGTFSGVYVSQEHILASEMLATPGEIDNYLAEHSVVWYIKCCLVENGEIIGYVYNDQRTIVGKNDEIYHITNFEETEAGFKNVRVLTEDQIAQLLLLYTKTYKLNEKENEEISRLFDNGGLAAVRDYIEEKFGELEKDAEKQQQAQAEQLNKSQESTEEETLPPVENKSATAEPIVEETVGIETEGDVEIQEETIPVETSSDVSTEELQSETASEKEASN